MNAWHANYGARAGMTYLRNNMVQIISKSGADKIKAGQ